jgi:hypothetical protein
MDNSPLHDKAGLIDPQDSSGYCSPVGDAKEIRARECGGSLNGLGNFAANFRLPLTVKVLAPTESLPCCGDRAEGPEIRGSRQMRVSDLIETYC